MLNNIERLEKRYDMLMAQANLEETDFFLAVDYLKEASKLMIQIEMAKLIQDIEMERL